ncbi:hypothetical protein [Vallitalea guaymasensis]|uniref:hypothetical protein n=1 Tax=Vallitalea guaymasensis TaxID=1185412 RepID=UPI0027299C7A|nr:hypothetical protein [Vallitalea guaymasensis]
MLLKSVRMQIKSILNHKEVFITVCILMLFVFINYFSNIIKYNGKDISDMYFPMKLLLLSSGSGPINYYFMQYFPLLVIIPVGFSYVHDRDSKEIIYIQSRVGLKHYYIGKIISVFLVAFFVFTIPFIIEMIFNCIAFPMNATGDLSNVNIYEKSYIEAVKNYFYYNLYVIHPYIYTLFITLVFGVICGILNVFVVAISMYNIKFKILLFLPVYILLYGIGMIGHIFPSIKVSLSYFDYLSIFDCSRKSLLGYCLIIVLILLVSIVMTMTKSRKDSL